MKIKPFLEKKKTTILMSRLPWRQLCHVWKEKCCGYSRGEDILFSKQDNSVLFASREVRIGKNCARGQE